MDDEIMAVVVGKWMNNSLSVYIRLYGGRLSRAGCFIVFPDVLGVPRCCKMFLDVFRVFQV